jgi:RNA polymerase sigma-70 factor (ECF subfamily)
MTETQRASWIDFFKKERLRLVRYVRSLIDDAADREGEDIVQEVVLGLFEKADISAPVENLAAYVYQSLRNRVIDAMRRRKPGKASLDAELPGDSGGTLADVVSDIAYDLEKELDHRAFNEDLRAALATLDEKYRGIVIATEVRGLSFKELSEAWKIPVGTLLAHKSRAMKKLREALVNIDPVHYLPLVKEGDPYE